MYFCSGGTSIFPVKMYSAHHLTNVFYNSPIEMSIPRVDAPIKLVTQPNIIIAWKGNINCGDENFTYRTHYVLQCTKWKDSNCADSNYSESTKQFNILAQYVV